MLFTDTKVQCKAQNIGVGRKTVNEIDPRCKARKLNLQSSPNQAWVVNCFKLFWEGFHITAFESIPKTQNIFYPKKSL